jgi:RNA polymerase sigma factor (sigma-70 family)
MRQTSLLATQQRADAVAAKLTEPGPRGGHARADDDAVDAALVERLRRGDGTAFRDLVARHVAIVAAIARRMLRDEAEAEDIAQEAMLRLWRSAAGLELGPGGLRPWLRRVTSNLCIDRVRSSQRTVVTDEVPEVAEPATQVTDLQDRDLSARVAAAMQALPDRQRLALTLFHHEGLSQIEVGQAMGISDEAVESLLARARRALKASLAAEWKELLENDG